jgi:hypothetical protein
VHEHMLATLCLICMLLPGYSQASCVRWWPRASCVSWWPRASCVLLLEQDPKKEPSTWEYIVKSEELKNKTFADMDRNKDIMKKDAKVCRGGCCCWWCCCCCCVLECWCSGYAHLMVVCLLCSGAQWRVWSSVLCVSLFWMVCMLSSALRCRCCCAAADDGWQVQRWQADEGG